MVNEIVLEVISAKGMCLDNDMRLRNIRLDIVHEDNAVQSPEYDYSNEYEVSLEFSAKFGIDSLDFQELRTKARPVYIYVSQSLAASDVEMVRSSDCQPVGLSFCRALICLATIDLRLAFLHAGEFLSVELVPCSSGGVVDTGYSGVLFLRLSVSGAALHVLGQADGSTGLPAAVADELATGIELQQRRLEKMGYEQYAATRAFFARLRSEFPYVEERGLKLMALDECGRHRMVCNFVGRVAPSRQLAGPRFSARYVSLLPFHRGVELIGGNTSCWHAPYCTAALLQGDVEDHALLLCSLLLGWGLDAYVVFGAIYSAASPASGGGGAVPALQPHYWVATLDGLAGSGDAGGSVTFWEPLTGQQYAVPVSAGDQHFTVLTAQAGPPHPFQLVYALFRDDGYWANTQLSPLLAHDAERGCPMAAFDLACPQLWARLPNQEYYCHLRHPAAAIPQGCEFRSRSHSAGADCPRYRVFGLFADALEERLEDAVRQLVRSLRQESGLLTEFSDQLSTMLQPALLAYEWDRATGCSFGNADFQLAVKKAVRRGECFKAFPTCFCFAHPPGIVSSLSRTSAFREVVFCNAETASFAHHSDSTLSLARFARHAVRVKVVQYSETVCAVWIIVAVCFAKEN